MPPVGYQEGSEGSWWWKVADHLDRAQLSLVNAMPYNVNDPRPGTALHARLCEAQAILLDIMRAKGLVPGAAPPQPPQMPAPHVPPMNFAPQAVVPPFQVQMPTMSEPAVPTELIDREFGPAQGTVPQATGEVTNGHIAAAEDVAPAAVDQPPSTSEVVVEAECSENSDLVAHVQLVPESGASSHAILDEKSAS